MLRTAVLPAGLGAALIVSALTAVGAPSGASQGPWVEQRVQEITAGQVYQLDGCLTVTASGVEFASLRLAWYEEPQGYGAALFVEDAPANPSLIGAEQCLSIGDADPPCAARSARYGVVVKGDATAIEVSSLELRLQPEATPVPCPTPTPSSTPTPTATLTPTPAAAASPQATATPKPTPPPSSPTPEPTPTTAEEPTLFPSLVNGGFEAVRADGTPYGWRKIGGEMSATGAVKAEGARSASLSSRTESTKWLYQTVSVEGGSYYRLQAKALKDDPAARELLLRISWYESADGSGSQIGTADSQALAADSPSFAALDTGPVVAPAEARSAKVKLLLRPVSSAPAIAYFDDVRFAKTAAPSPVEGASVSPQAGAAAPGARAAASDMGARREPPSAALSTWAGPTPLANVRQERAQRPAPAGGGGRPLWPLLLAFGVPGVGMAVMAGSAWRKGRLAARNEPHI